MCKPSVQTSKRNFHLVMGIVRLICSWLGLHDVNESSLGRAGNETLRVTIDSLVREVYSGCVRKVYSGCVFGTQDAHLDALR